MNDTDVEWIDIHRKEMINFLKLNKFEVCLDLPEKLGQECFVAETFKGVDKYFIQPMIKALDKNHTIKSWHLWNVKALILQFYRVLNAMFFRLVEAKHRNKDADDPMMFPIYEVRRDVVFNIALTAFTATFGVCFDDARRQTFEEIFGTVRKQRFNISINSTSVQRPTMFEIYYDVERLSWEVIQEKLDYKLKLQYYPRMSQLLVPTANISLAYFILDNLTYYMKQDQKLDKNFRLLGPQGTSKSVILNTFLMRTTDKFDSIIVPMSAYLAFDRLRKVVESKYITVRKKKYQPRDENKKIIIMIDDVHLQSNLRNNIIEFIRSWTSVGGYFDVGAGYFKRIGDFGVIMGQNSEYRQPRGKCELEGREPFSNRFLFYTNTQYVDEMPTEKFKPFIQHWLTSKMWAPNKLVQKYYIIITNCMLKLMEAIKRKEGLIESSFSKLHSFDILAKFCSSLVMNTVISDDAKEIGTKGQKEEDVMANVVLYEVMRNYADRICKPSKRTEFMEECLAIFEEEFQMKDPDLAYIDALVIGNYHEKSTMNYIRYVNQEDRLYRVKDMIQMKLVGSTNNHFLQSVLDQPAGIRDVFRLSRILFKEQQHLIMCGASSTTMHEMLQVATLLNDVIMLELDAPKYNEPSKFAAAFKQALSMIVRYDGLNAYLVVNDHQLRDPVYIDFLYNYVCSIGKEEDCILMDEQFREMLLEIEIELFKKNPENFKYDKNKQPNLKVCMNKAIDKLMRHCHIVLMINDMQTYHEWISLFPGLETKFDMMFVDDLHINGYEAMTRTFLERSKKDEDLEQKELKNLVEGLCLAKDQAKDKMFQLFHDRNDQKYMKQLEYQNGYGIERMYPSNAKANFKMLTDPVFQVYHPLIKQVNYNVFFNLENVMKGHYVQYLEVFRFLYDFLSLNLSIRKNYYNTFIQKTRQFKEFFKDITSKKRELHGASNNLNLKVTMTQDKMNRINKSIADKTRSIIKRQKEIEDLALQLKNQQQEVDQVMEEKNIALANVLESISCLKDRDLIAVIHGAQNSQSEQHLLAMVAMVIEKDSTVEEFEIEVHGPLLQAGGEEFALLLQDRARFEFDISVYRKLKDFLGRYLPNDFAKSLNTKLLYQYISDLYRKLNVRNTMSSQFAQIAEIRQSIDSSKFSINYSEQYIKERRAELKILEDKIIRVKERDGKLSKKIEVAEISSMRTNAIFENVRDYGSKVQSKLENIESRIRSLLGDCIILASSVVFMGHFSSHERIELRSKIVDLLEKKDIECSKEWFLEGKQSPQPKIQTKMFKAILKEYGLRNFILPHQYSGIITQATLCETLFHLIFAPSCPIICDPTGEVQNYLKTRIISKLAAKQCYASSLDINQVLSQTLKSQTGFGLLNDLNSYEKASFGLTQDQSLLHRLCQTFCNGVDFNYERKNTWSKHSSGTDSLLFTSFGCLNKKIPVNEPGLENISMYQVQVFTPSFDYQFGELFMSKAACHVSMSNNEDILDNPDGVNAWMEIKELLLEQINNHEWKQLQEIKAQIKFYDENKGQLNRTYENAFLVANHDTLQSLDEYSGLKNAIEDIQSQSEERMLYKRMYSEMIKKYEILTFYSKVILNMYLSLKVLSKIMNEVTYSWRMFKVIIKQILESIIRQMVSDTMAKKKKGGLDEVDPRVAHRAANLNNPLLQKPQIDIDLRFFQKTFIPKLHKTIMTSVRQEASAPLFNLIFAMRISILQDKITLKENNFFFDQLMKLDNFQDWRKTEIDFVDMQSAQDPKKFSALKRDLIKMYPDLGLKFTDLISKECGEGYVYADASMVIFKLFKDHEFASADLMKLINLGFACPDHEFKSRLTQNVYETLCAIFDFTEEYSRLHQLLSRASWKQPIALLSVTHVNMINTISSIAQHYGVGLDVVRTDNETDVMMVESKRGIDIKRDNLIKQNLIDHASAALDTREQQYAKLQLMATTYLKKGNVCADKFASMSKLNYLQNAMRQQFDNPDKKLSEIREESPVKIIERAARTGSWVLVSTIRFPQFWKKVQQMLERLDEKNLIDDQFRLIFDLQGYAQNDISDSFLFDSAVLFHMTEQNVEEFQGYDDIWTAILDERVLQRLWDKVDSIHDKKMEDPRGSQSSMSMESADVQKMAKASPSNYKLIEGTIKSGNQRDLYRQFMQESKKENQGLKFDLQKAQEPDPSEQKDSLEEGSSLIDHQPIDSQSDIDGAKLSSLRGQSVPEPVVEQVSEDGEDHADDDVQSDQMEEEQFEGSPPVTERHVGQGHFKSKEESNKDSDLNTMHNKQAQEEAKIGVDHNSSIQGGTETHRKLVVNTALNSNHTGSDHQTNSIQANVPHEVGLAGKAIASLDGPPAAHIQSGEIPQQNQSQSQVHLLGGLADQEKENPEQMKSSQSLQEKEKKK